MRKVSPELRQKIIELWGNKSQKAQMRSVICHELELHGNELGKTTNDMMRPAFLAGRLVLNCEEKGRSAEAFIEQLETQILDSLKIFS